MNILKKLSDKEFYAPGSILAMDVEVNHPVGYGMERRCFAYFTNGPAFRLLPYRQESTAVAYYPDRDVLQDGWLVGERRIAGATAVAEVPVERGRVVLFGIRPQNRGQTHGTFKLLFNAILQAGSEPAEILK